MATTECILEPFGITTDDLFTWDETVLDAIRDRNPNIEQVAVMCVLKIRHSTHLKLTQPFPSPFPRLPLLQPNLRFLVQYASSSIWQTLPSNAGHCTWPERLTPVCTRESQLQG